MAQATTTPAPSKAALLAAARAYKAKEGLRLLAHATGRWGRKVNGRIVYFGPITNTPDFGSEAARAEYDRTIDDVRNGRTPRPKDAEVLTCKQAVNAYLRAKKKAVATGEMAPRTWADYKATSKRILRVFGSHRAVDDLRPADFDRLRNHIAKTRGPVAIGNEVQRVRTIFKFAFDYELVKQPVAFGPAFKRPSRRVLRLEAKRHGSRMLEAAEIRTILDAADQPLKAMVWLGINGGMGNSDCANLPMAALDLDGAWLDYPRPKTGIDRRIPLWPETVAALREWLKQRPKPKRPEHEALVFITKRKLSWAKATEDNPISKEFRKLLDSIHEAAVEKATKAGVEPPKPIYRPGIGFYSLRRAFETIGGDAKDQVSVDAIMGHCDPSMAAVYRQKIDDGRLRAVVDHVRQWLWPAESTSSSVQ